MDIGAAVNHLLEHAKKVDAEFAAIRTEMRDMRTEMRDMRGEMAKKSDVDALRADIREGTKAMRHYVGYVESLLNTVTKGQLSLEDQVQVINTRMDDMQRRINELERRNPPHAA